MKNKITIIALAIVATLCFSIMSGCWVDTASIEFVTYPAATYYEGDDATAALSFTIKDNNTNTVIEYANGVATTNGAPIAEAVEVKGFNLATPGNYTAVVTYMHSSLEFSYTVIAKDEKFAGGDGSQANPYQIRNAQQMQNITSMYEEGYKYYAIAPGVTSIDCTGWSSVKLNGSFNGNGVVFNNVTKHLFSYVGRDLNTEATVIENFEAVMNFASGSDASMVKNINGINTTFKNVIVSGYLEGTMNSGSFYSYGTCNGTENGGNYTVNFVNCESKATLVATGGNVFGRFVGHTYPGTGYAVTLNFDAATKFTGKMLSAKKKMNAYCAIVNGKIYVNGVETANTQSSCDGVTVIAPALGEDGYYIAKAEGAAKIVVYIAPQLSAYDEEGNPIANSQGITMAFHYQDITNVAASTKVFELFNLNAIEIVNGDAELKTGLYGDAAPYTLIVSTGSSTNYLKGSVSLQVNQYDVLGNVVACGTLKMGDIA